MNNKALKKIVFVLPSLVAGGAERVLITLMNALDRTKFDPHLLVLNDEGPLKDLVADDIPYHYLGQSGLRVGKSVPRLVLKLRSLRPDIVVSTMAHMNFGVLAAKPFMPGVKFIVREAVTPDLFFQGNPLRIATIKAAFKIMYPLADQVISPAQLIIDELGRMLGLKVDDYVCLPNPVNMDKIRGDEQAADWPHQGVRFVAAGRLHPQKGFDRLLEILPQMPHQDWHLTILGEGDQRPDLEHQIKKRGLQDHVTLHGLAARPWPYFAAADAFLLPSRQEGLPNVALESLACGTPVISMHEAGGITEIAQDAPGHVTIANDMTAFLEAMKAVTPQGKTSYRPSLLPSRYRYEDVMRQFEEILLS